MKQLLCNRLRTHWPDFWYFVFCQIKSFYNCYFQLNTVFSRSNALTPQKCDSIYFHFHHQLILWWNKKQFRCMQLLFLRDIHTINDIEVLGSIVLFQVIQHFIIFALCWRRMNIVYFYLEAINMTIKCTSNISWPSASLAFLNIK